MNVLDEALTGWRKTRSPRFAQLAQWATARELREPRPLVGAGRKKKDAEAWLALLEAHDALDVPRLVEALLGMPSQVAADHLALLGKLDDPRVVSGVLALLEAPAWRARTALPFFRAAAKLLADANDPRVREALLDLSTRYKAIIDSSMGDEVALLLRRTAESLDQVKPGPLSATWEKKCSTLEAEFETERAQAARAVATKKKSAQSDDALLEAIYAAPDDDGPRLVYADTLTERGDVRGELISLQLSHARGHGTPQSRARERELLSDPKHRGAWGHPLSQGGACHFTRGFTELLVIEPRTLKHIVGQRALRTVQRVHGFTESVAIKHGKAFLEHEHARHFRHVEALSSSLVDALEGQLPWPGVGFAFVPSRHVLERFPHLTRLKVHAAWHQPFDPAGLQGLERVVAFDSTGTSPTSDFLSGMPNLKELALAGFVEPALLATMLKGRPLESLDLKWRLEPGQVRLESLRHLSLMLQGKALRLADVLDDFPGLRTLKLHGSALQPELFAAFFGEARLRQLDVFHLNHNLALLRPGKPDGELEIRQFSAYEPELARLTAAVAALPDGLVRRVVLRPHSTNPNMGVGVVLPEEAQARLRGAKPGLPLDVEWW